MFSQKRYRNFLPYHRSRGLGAIFSGAGFKGKHKWDTVKGTLAHLPAALESLSKGTPISAALPRPRHKRKRPSLSAPPTRTGSRKKSKRKSTVPSAPAPILLPAPPPAIPPIRKPRKKVKKAAAPATKGKPRPGAKVGARKKSKVTNGSALAKRLNNIFS